MARASSLVRKGVNSQAHPAIKKEPGEESKCLQRVLGGLCGCLSVNTPPWPGSKLDPGVALNRALEVDDAEPQAGVAVDLKCDFSRDFSEWPGVSVLKI